MATLELGSFQSFVYPISILLLRLENTIDSDTEKV